MEYEGSRIIIIIIIIIVFIYNLPPKNNVQHAIDYVMYVSSWVL